MIPASINFTDQSNLRQFGYIAFSSLIAETITYPLERIKTKLQSKGQNITKSFLGYQEMHIQYLDVVKAENHSGLYYGLKFGLDRHIFFHIFRFYGYYLGVNHIFGMDKHFNIKDVLLSGLLGTTLATMITQPSEVFKIKVQSEKLGYSQEKFVKIVEKYETIRNFHSGHKVFSTGLFTSLLYQNLITLVEIPVFFYFRDYIKNQFDSKYWRNGLSILLASFASTFIAAPFDFLNSRTIMRGLNKEKTPLIQYIKYVIGKEGFTGLYKGFLPLLLKNMTTNLVMITILQKFLDRDERKKAYTKVIIDELDAKLAQMDH